MPKIYTESKDIRDFPPKISGVYQVTRYATDPTQSLDTVSYAYFDATVEVWGCREDTIKGAEEAYEEIGECSVLSSYAIEGRRPSTLHTPAPRYAWRGLTDYGIKHWKPAK